MHSASHYLIHILYKITNSPQEVIVLRWSQSNLYPPRIGFERKLPSLAHLLESSYFDSATAEPTSPDCRNSGKKPPCHLYLVEDGLRKQYAVISGRLLNESSSLLIARKVSDPG